MIFLSFTSRDDGSLLIWMIDDIFLPKWVFSQLCYWIIVLITIISDQFLARFPCTNFQNMLRWRHVTMKSARCRWMRVGWRITNGKLMVVVKLLPTPRAAWDKGIHGTLQGVGCCSLGMVMGMVMRMVMRTRARDALSAVTSAHSAFHAPAVLLVPVSSLAFSVFSLSLPDQAVTIFFSVWPLSDCDLRLVHLTAVWQSTCYHATL